MSRENYLGSSSEVDDLDDVNSPQTLEDDDMSLDSAALADDLSAELENDTTREISPYAPAPSKARQEASRKQRMIRECAEKNEEIKRYMEDFSCTRAEAKEDLGY